MKVSEETVTVEKGTVGGDGLGFGCGDGVGRYRAPAIGIAGEKRVLVDSGDMGSIDPVWVQSGPVRWWGPRSAGTGAPLVWDHYGSPGPRRRRGRSGPFSERVGAWLWGAPVPESRLSIRRLARKPR